MNLSNNGVSVSEHILPHIYARIVDSKPRRRIQRQTKKGKTK